MFTEKVEVTGKGGGPIETSDRDLARAIASLLSKGIQVGDA